MDINDQLSDILTETYQSPSGFVSAYSMNPDKVFRTFVKKLDVVPFDLKERLAETFISLTTSKADDRDSA